MTQRVLVIHGPPACGKLSTARALAEVHPMPVLHNHLTFNLARELFEFGDPRLNDLHREMRLTMLSHALKAPLPDIVLTMVYSEPESVPVIHDIIELTRRHNARLCAVFLHCSDKILLSRVGDPGRAVERKLQSRTRLAYLLENHRYGPIPDADTYEIDNSELSAADVARLIAERFFPPGS